MKTEYIPQVQLPMLRKLAVPGKVALIYGPRRVGKTTLLQHFAEQETEPLLSVTGEDIEVRAYLESQSLAKLTAFVGSRKLLMVDEAQHVRDIGLNLKLLVDHVPGLRIVATGSSAFDLAHGVGAPLAGRQHTLWLLPLAQMELEAVEPPHETAAALELRLVYGSYPEVVLSEANEDRQRFLRELVAAYLFKDLLQLEDIRHADKLTRLLQLLAFQIGQEVSDSELGTQLGLSKNTVARYLDLLEKVFVIYARRGFSRNPRKEIAKGRRYYFFDNGIRNTLINNFNPLPLRGDAGALWENYLITERLKANQYLQRRVQSYFWRTYSQQEVDVVEEGDGRLAAFEIKWNQRRTRGAPPRWTAAYPQAAYAVVNRENYLPFVRGA